MAQEADKVNMTKLFGESIAHIVAGAFRRGAADTFDMSGNSAYSKKMKEYFEQDPKVLDAQARLDDLEAIAMDKIIATKESWKTARLF